MPVTVVRAQATEAPQASPEPPAEAPAQIDAVRTYKLAPTVRNIKGSCQGKLRFEVEYMQKRGTSDNSYLITVPGANALVDVPYEAYLDKFMESLSSNIQVTELTHIIITHLDPKAIPTLKAVLNKLATAGKSPTVVLSNPGLRLLQSVFGEKKEDAHLLSAAQYSVARSGMSLTLGHNCQLQLQLTPTPRWPDLMMAYMPSERILFSSKFFSAHVASPDDHAEELGQLHTNHGSWEAFKEDWRYFFECMLAPSPRQAATALDKLPIVPANRPSAPVSLQESLAKAAGSLTDFSWLRSVMGFPELRSKSGSGSGAAPEQSMMTCMLAPMHGPVVGSALTQLVGEYRNWVDEQLKASDVASVAVFYASAYGNTSALAQAISRGITKSAVGVNTYNLETVPLEEVSEAITKSDGFIIGSPTLGGHMPTQVAVALGSIIREQKAKALPCGVFGSFGWSGEAVDEMEGRLRDAGFRAAFPAIRVKFRPTAKDVLLCEESGRDLAMAVKKRAKARETSTVAASKAVTTASGPQLAAGRLVGSLSVLTAQDEDATAAMLASWVSQASFEPPGLTVSVKKDRAMEPLLMIGNKFAISTVAEGKEKVVMRRLARPFAPGEDRLAGLATRPSKNEGIPVLEDANAHMECQVVSRMEAGDHFVVYATVLDGQVQSEAPTAVHHRKVANHY